MKARTIDESKFPITQKVELEVKSVSLINKKISELEERRAAIIAKACKDHNIKFKQFVDAYRYLVGNQMLK